MTSYGKESSTYSSHILVIIDQFIKYNTRLNGQYHASINGKLRRVMITLTLMDERLVMCTRCSSNHGRCSSLDIGCINSHNLRWKRA